MNETKNGGIGANPERENDDSRGSEPWRLVKLPDGELKILDHMQWDARSGCIRFKNRRSTECCLD